MRHINIHILRTITIANLNRERNGAPKTGMSGGTLRNRIASQAIKRPIRTSYETASDGDRTTRSKLFHEANSDLCRSIVTHLKEQGVDVDKTVADNIDLGHLPATLRDNYKPVKATKTKVTAHVELDLPVKAAVTLLVRFYLDRLVAKPETVEKKYGVALAAIKAGETLSPELPADDGNDSSGDEAGDTLLWLAESELEGFAAPILGQFLGDNHATVEQFDMLQPGRTRSLTIAAFGRMFAARPDLQNRAALQVAHAFSTHVYATTPDYFTAVDDLSLSLHGHSGAGHISQAQYTSATFYSHLTVNVEELAANWIAPDDPEVRTQRLAAFYRELFLAMPSGRTNVTAPTNLPDYIAVTPAARACTLATAFEAPVAPDATSGGGYTKPSIERLKAYAGTINRFAPSVFGDTLEADIYHGSGATLDELTSRCVTLTEQAIDEARRKANT